MFCPTRKTKSRPARPSRPKDSGYEQRKENERLRQAAMSATGRDIGDLPPVADQERRDACRESFRAFCETYGKRRFTKGWSSGHLLAIQKIERAVLFGGKFALAMPRGSGKTTLADFAVVWSVLYGHHPYAVLLGATQSHGKKRLIAIKRELLSNEMLLADFPEAIVPLKKLQGIAQRAKGQTYHGEPTEIVWSAAQIVLPTIDGAASSGAIIECGGLLTAVRGLQYTRPDGTIARPSFVLIDDPQTRASARSRNQCDARESILQGELLYLAGPGEPLACVMPCTVIEPDDLAARMLDKDRNPEWQGEITKLLDAFPSNMELWQEYAELRRNEMADGGTGKRATAFYRKHRKAMDEGAKPTWPERFEPGELSALQHAMNLYFRDRASFMAEMQNSPDSDGADDEFLDAKRIARNTNSHRRGIVPAACGHVTAFVDVQKDVLFWLVAAWQDNFTGYVLDYGTFPDQRSSYFSIRSLRNTLAKWKPRARMEGRLTAALGELLDTLRDRQFESDDGTSRGIDLAMVDANWGESTDVVYAVTAGRPNVFPSHGKGIKASDRPMHEWNRQPGERRADHAIMRTTKERKPAARYVLYDTNHWKTFVARSLSTALGDAGSLSLFDAPPNKHKLIADHLSAEKPIATSGRGRDLFEWRLPPGADNHWLDCLVGSAVAASFRGVRLAETTPTAPKKRAPSRSRVKYL